MKKQKEYYFRVGIFRFYITVDPDEVLPFVRIAVAVETKKMRAWKRKRQKIRG